MKILKKITTFLLIATMSFCLVPVSSIILTVTNESATSSNKINEVQEDIDYEYINPYYEAFPE